MDEPCQFIGIEQHPGAPGLAEQRIDQVLLVWILRVRHRNQFVAFGIGKNAQRSCEVTGNLHCAVSVIGPHQHPHDCRVHQASGLFDGRIGQFRHVHEERLAVIVRDRTDDVLRPGMARRLEDHLKKRKLAFLQFGQRADNTDEGIEFAATKQEHEFAGQTELDCQAVFALAGIPGLDERSFTGLEHCFWEIRLQLAAHRRGVARTRCKLRRDPLRPAQKLECDRLAAERKTRQELLERFVGYIELGWQDCLQLNQRLAWKRFRFGFFVFVHHGWRWRLGTEAPA